MRKKREAIREKIRELTDKRLELLDALHVAMLGDDEDAEDEAEFALEQNQAEIDALLEKFVGTRRNYGYQEERASNTEEDE